MAQVQKQITEIDIPKSKEYMSLIATKDTLSIGDYFTSGYNGTLIQVYKIEDDHVFYSEVSITDGSVIRKQYSSSNIDHFINEYSEKYIPNLEYYRGIAEDIIAGKPYDFGANIEEHSDSALMCMNNKNTLIGLYSSTDVIQKHMSIVKSCINSIKECERNRIQQIEWQLSDQIKKMNAKMVQIMKVIRIIELYTGVEEELYQLQSGEPAPIDAPLTIHQLVLYADEEVGITGENSIDFRNLNLFDEWLIEDKRYESILPFPKSIIAFKPRRNAKDYRDPRDNAILNVWNKQTYFLIRNGDNIYRICTENIGVGLTVFPLRSDVDRIFNNNSSGVEQLKEQYMKFSAFLQGLIDRTEIFEPLPAGVRVSDIEDNNLQLIYDAEPSLTDGRISYNDWKTELNKEVTVGSRILLVPDPCAGTCNSYSYRYTGEGFLRYYSNDFSVPYCPSPGLYTLEQVPNEDLVCIKFPHESRYLWGDKVSNRKCSWVVSLNISLYINYDMLCLDDLEYYLNNRSLRSQYVEILPLLIEARTQLKKEQALEYQFIDMMIIELKGYGLTGDDKLRKDIEDSVNWWKFKNKYKRPITEDDVKAVRMIRKRIFSLYDVTKKKK